MQTAEYLIDNQIWYENLVVFDVTCFSVVFPQSESIFEDNAIVVCFVVLKSSVRCQKYIVMRLAKYFEF